MFRFFSLSVFIFISNFCLGQITDSISGYYPFSGNSLNNQYSGIDDFQQVGSPNLAADRFGNPDCSYQFYGDSTNYLTIPSPSENYNIKYSSGWSISLWYKGGSSSTTDLEPIYSQNDGVDICNQISLSNNNKPFAEVFSSNGNDMIEALADEDLTNPNEYMDSTIWHHVVFSVKPLEYIKLFIDNELQDTTGIDNNVNDFCESPIILGKYFKGQVDDVIIYQKALDEMEVDTIFNLPSSCDQNALNLQEIKTIENGIEVFPNPTKNILNINSSVTYNQFLLTNTMGQHIYAGSLNQNLNQIDVSHIPNGMYYLTIDSDKNNTIKVIINH